MWRGRVGRRGERERSRGDERDVVLWVLGPEGRVERGETEREKRETSAAGKGLQKAVWGRGARIEGEKCAPWSAARHVDGERETGEGVRVQRENLWERCPRGEEQMIRDAVREEDIERRGGEELLLILSTWLLL